MKKIFATSEEKYLKSAVLYASTDDCELYMDSDLTLAASADVVTNLYLKNQLTISHDGNLYHPIAIVSPNDPSSFKVWCGTSVVEAEADTEGGGGTAEGGENASSNVTFVEHSFYLAV